MAPARSLAPRPPGRHPVRRLGTRSLGWLIYLHRWLGIAGCLLFIAWFISGIVMMYARMPSVTAAERFTHAAPIDPAGIALGPAAAAARAGVTAGDAVRVAMLDGRPVYRFAGRPATTVYADTGETVAPVSADRALSIASRWAHGSTTPHYDALVTEPDQWTLQTREHLPLHRIALGNDGDAYVYVSSHTGEVVMDTARAERFWAYWGPVMHWLYLPVLRRNGPLWTDVIIWSSGIGCVMCVAGLVIGLLRFSPYRRFRLRRGHQRSPYAGMMRWHHYAGLLFGVVTLTFTFSGLLSMGPFAWLSSGRLTPEQRGTLAGTPPALDVITGADVREAVSALGSEPAPRELALVTFRGHRYWSSEVPADASRAARSRVPVAQAKRTLVSAAEPARGPFKGFERSIAEQGAREMLPDAAILDTKWLDEYDAYYYDRQGTRPLPVLRVRYGDAESTWVYLDPATGAVALMSRAGGRANRWLYHGLHSLDLPALYYSRPLWDIFVIALSLGGIALGATSLAPAWRRLARHTGRLTRGVTAAGRAPDAGAAPHPSLAQESRQSIVTLRGE